MRPLTETIPKPLIPLVDRPFLALVLERLAAAGVEEVLLSSPYLGHRFEAFVGAWSRAPRISWVTEREPLGTAGAVAHAARHLDAAFLVCNGDILTDLDLAALVEAHRSAGAVATIALTPVADARPYGLVETDPTGRVLAFREKPSEPAAANVNAGTYVLEPEAVAAVPSDRAVSIERETFPALIGSGRRVQGFVCDAYWMDLGTPERYLRASFDVLEGRVLGLQHDAPYVDATASVAPGATIGRSLVVSAGVVIEDGADADRSVLLQGATVRPGATVRSSILGPRSTVGAGATLEGAILAEGAVVPAGAVACGARVGAGASVDG